MDGIDEAREFRDRGAIVVRGAFTDWVERLEPSPDGCRYTRSGDPGGFRDDDCNGQRIPERFPVVWRLVSAPR